MQQALFLCTIIPNHKHTCCPFFQIYNEMVRDLLNPSAGYLEMREDAKGGVQVANLSEVSTSSTEEVKKCGS